MTLGKYIKKRNGVAMGHPQSLKNNLSRSFGAKSFASFWSYWNPVFGYYLGIKIFRPLKQFLPVTIALIATFVFCGLIHDLVSILFRGKTVFLFAIWFLLMGTAVVISNYFKQNLAQYRWLIRAFAHLFIILICLCLAYFLSRFLNMSIVLF